MTCTACPQIWDLHPKFARSFLATIAWHSFSRLGATLNKGEEEFWVSLRMSNIFIELYYENVASLDNFCDWLSINWWIWMSRVMLFNLFIETRKSIWPEFGKEIYCLCVLLICDSTESYFKSYWKWYRQQLTFLSSSRIDLIIFIVFNCFSVVGTNLIVIGVPYCGCRLSTSFNMIEFITHFSVSLVFFNILLILFIFYSFLSKTFNVFQFQRPNCSCFSGIKVVVPLRVVTEWLMSIIDVSHFRWSVLAPWDLIKCKSLWKTCL